jgi:hypothetical protein
MRLVHTNQHIPVVEPRQLINERGREGKQELVFAYSQR